MLTFRLLRRNVLIGKRLKSGGKITVRVHGRFRVLAENGTDLTPQSAKSQALLALVLANDEFERGRLWLQDKLWSDRPAKQGGDSLRQALRKIRIAFGDLSDILIASRSIVRLDRARVEIEKPDPDIRGEFLEGIDVRDSEFNLWLAEERSLKAPADLPSSASPDRRQRYRAISLLFQTESANPGFCQVQESRFVERVTRSLRESLNIEILRRQPSQAQPGILLASVQAFEATKNNFALRVSLEDVDANRILWSELGVAQIGEDQSPEQETRMLALVHKMSDAIRWAALRQKKRRATDTDANLLAIMAVQKIFTLRGDELVEAERMLMQAFEIEKRGVYKSWLAQLYTIQFVERLKTLDQIAEKSNAACAHALELEPENSNVLASVADANLAIRRNFARSAQLAKMSVEANPSNPLAWWTMAAGHLYLNEKAKAHHAASIAQILAGGTRLRFWTDIQRGLTALVNGKTVEGLRNLESSSALSPGFRAPLRYRAATYASAGMTKLALECAETLKALEPDFSFDRMANDPDYPVSLMRKHGMLDTIRLE